MVPQFPLFPGIPGGPELLIVLLVMVIVLGVPTLLVAAAAFFGLRYFRGGDTRAERIEELEREVYELRQRLGEERTPSDARADDVRPTDDFDADDSRTDDYGGSDGSGDSDGRER